jgi:hypothetical protein
MSAQTNSLHDGATLRFAIKFLHISDFTAREPIEENVLWLSYDSDRAEPKNRAG